MTFSEKFSTLRKKANVSKEQLSDHLLVSIDEIERWESGESYPDIEKIRGLAELFKISPEVLLSGEEMLIACERDRNYKVGRIRNMAIACMDMLMMLSFFIPLFKYYAVDFTYYVSLMVLPSGGRPYKLIFAVFVIAAVVLGVLRIVLFAKKQNFKEKPINFLSMLTSTILVVCFTVLNEPYAAVYTFFLMLAKVMLLIKRQ